MVLLTSCGHVQDRFWAYLLAVSKLHLCTFMRSLQPLLSRPCFCCFRVTVFLSTNVPTRKSHVLVLSQVRVALAWPIGRLGKTVHAWPTCNQRGVVDQTRTRRIERRVPRHSVSRGQQLFAREVSGDFSETGAFLFLVEALFRMPGRRQSKCWLRAIAAEIRFTALSERHRFLHPSPFAVSVFPCVSLLLPDSTQPLDFFLSVYWFSPTF